MSHQIILADERGKFAIELFDPDGGVASSIMLSVTPGRPQTEYFALDATDARLIAAALMDYADKQDALADTGNMRKIDDEAPTLENGVVT